MTFLYLSFFFYQCWIYKHFPIIYERRVHHTPESSPHARRLKARKAHPCGVAKYMRRLGTFTVEDAI